MKCKRIVSMDIPKRGGFVNQIEVLIPKFEEKCNNLMMNTRYGFTRRESEVLVLSCYDFDIEKIANLMHRSPKTILKHRENAKQKTPFSTLICVATSIWPLINS